MREKALKGGKGGRREDDGGQFKYMKTGQHFSQKSHIIKKKAQNTVSFRVEETLHLYINKCCMPDMTCRLDLKMKNKRQCV